MDDAQPARETHAPVNEGVLRQLGPEFQGGRHSDYARMILDGIEGRGSAIRRPARNIALTGRYGSGKSSVLQEVERQLGTDVVNISLSTLTTIEDGVGDPDTPQLQKEIVKQLIYGSKPQDTPDSRFHRIERFRKRLGFVTASAVSIVAFLLLTLTGTLDSVAARLTAGSVVLAYLVVTGIALGLGALTFGIARAMHARIRIDAISAASASISLAKPERDYFDQFLDEIVYFFEVTGRRVVIFEDIDRFGDADIFDSLRGLNDLLNRSARVKQSVTFVYAVRDSVFEDAHRAGAGKRKPVDPLGARTKFFDLIVPIVPFATHRTARDLIHGLFGQSGETELEITCPDVPNPSDDVIRVIAPHVSDMRLMTNIVNEYAVFGRRLLGGPLDLDPDRLFAMIAYKNISPSEFEKISEGDSELDKVFDRFDAAVRATVVDLGTRLADARAGDGAAKRAKELRDDAAARLQALLEVSNGVNGGDWQPANWKLAIGKVTTTLEDPSEQFWTSLGSSDTDLTVGAPTGYSVTVPRSLVKGVLGAAFPAGGFAGMSDVERVELVKSLSDQRDRVRWSALAELAEADLELAPGVLDGSRTTESGTDMEREEDEASSLTAGRLIEHCQSPLGRALLRSGHINRDFVLYVARYLGVTVSANVKSFELRHVARGVSNPLYPFHTDAEVAALLGEVGDDLVDQPAVLNVMVIDHIARARPDLLGRAAATAASLEEEAAEEFLTIYLEHGTEARAFLAELAPRSPQLLQVVAGLEPSGGVATAEILDAVLGHTESRDIGEHAANLHELIATAASEMKVWELVSVDQADTVAAILEQAEFKIADLRGTSEVLRPALAARGLFALTADNLLAVGATDEVPGIAELVKLGDGASSLLAREFEAYLAILVEQGSRAGGFDDAAEALQWVSESSPDLIAPAVDALEPDVRLDPKGVPESAWVSLASTNRMRSLDSDLVAVASSLDDETLATWLRQCELTTTDATASSAAAVIVVNCTGLTAEIRLRHLEKLEYPAVASKSLKRGSAPVLGTLIAKKSVTDSVDTLEVAMGLGMDEIVVCLNSLSAIEDLIPVVSWDIDDLDELLASDEVSVETRTSIAFDVLDVRGTSSQSVSAVADFVLASEVKLDPMRRERLFAGAPSEQAIRLLTRDFVELSYAEVESALNAFGGEYSRLTTEGNSGVVLQDTPANIMLLDLLSEIEASPVLRRDEDKDGNPRSPRAHEAAPDA